LYPGVCTEKIPSSKTLIKNTTCFGLEGPYVRYRSFAHTVPRKNTACDVDHDVDGYVLGLILYCILHIILLDSIKKCELVGTAARMSVETVIYWAENGGRNCFKF